MEAIVNSPGLVYLIGMILLMAAFLAAYIVYFITRRRKKSNMKHGIHPSKSKKKEIAASKEIPADELEATTGVLSEEVTNLNKAPAYEAEVKANVLSSPIPARSSPSNQVSTSLEDKLNLGLLGISREPEVIMENTSKPVDQKPVDLAARLAPSPVNTPSPPQATEPVELLRLLRDPQSGQLIVEVAGQRYTKLANITDKKVGQYVLKLTAHLLAFTNGVIITDAGMKPVYNPKGLKEVPMPIGPSSTSAPRSPGPPARTPPPAPPQKIESDLVKPLPIPEPSPEPEPTSLSSLLPPSPPPKPPLQPGGLFQPASPPPSMLELNLAEEINDIVQARLQYSSLANNRIEITSDHQGGIRIEVNHQFYDSPDDVPDPEIKELIKASIKEWESK